MASKIEPYTSLLKPGVVPPMIGQFIFNTCNTQVFDVSDLIPKTARDITVVIYMRSGCEATSAQGNIWIWTELGNDRKDIKFKRFYYYAQNAVSFDSETFTFSYSREHPKLYLMSDVSTGQNIILELFVVGYAE